MISGLVRETHDRQLSANFTFIIFINIIILPCTFVYISASTLSVSFILIIFI